MIDPAAEGARAAARRLAPEHGPALIADVEAALHARDTGDRREQYVDPVSLASPIVSAAALAWTVYTDLKKNTAKPSSDVVTRTVTTQLRRTQSLTAGQEETVTITVQETINPPHG